MVTGAGMKLNGQASDSALALSLVCLVIGLHTNQKIWYLVSSAVIIILLVAPQFFIPLGRFWFGIAKVLGNLISKIILTLVYIMIVLPVGAIRRLFGADPMRLKQWKRGSESVFQTRCHQFSRDDFKNAY